MGQLQDTGGLVIKDNVGPTQFDEECFFSNTSKRSRDTHNSLGVF